MRGLVLVALMTLAGCKSQAEKDLETAKGDYEYLRAGGATESELCVAATKVMEAHVRARSPDGLDFQIDKQRKATACLNY